MVMLEKVYIYLKIKKLKKNDLWFYSVLKETFFIYFLATTLGRGEDY